MIFKDIYNTVQVDLVEYPRYKGTNDMHRYILVVIDCLSKMAWTRPLTKKTGKKVAAGLDSIFESMPRIPTLFSSDRGKEFSPTDPDIKRIVRDKYHMIMFTLKSSVKASIVERFNRTLKERLERYFTETGKHRWVDVLEKFTRNYNRSYHSTIKMAPVDVTSDKVGQVLLNVYPDAKKLATCTPSPFKKGDRVRVALIKKPFDKGYKQSISIKIITSLLTMSRLER